MNNELIYLDTNVIMDFLLGRDENAYHLIMRSISCEFCILTSDLVIKELHRQNLDIEMKNLFNLLKNHNKLIIDAIFQSDHISATSIVKFYPTHYSDALHKAIAKRNNVRYLVTKNMKDFSCFRDINVVKPDEIILSR